MASRNILKFADLLIFVHYWDFNMHIYWGTVLWNLKQHSISLQHIKMAFKYSKKKTTCVLYYNPPYMFFLLNIFFFIHHRNLVLTRVLVYHDMHLWYKSSDTNMNHCQEIMVMSSNMDRLLMMKRMTLLSLHHYGW